MVGCQGRMRQGAYRDGVWSRILVAGRLISGGGICLNLHMRKSAYALNAVTHLSDEYKTLKIENPLTQHVRTRQRARRVVFALKLVLVITIKSLFRNIWKKIVRLYLVENKLESSSYQIRFSNIKVVNN